MHSTLDKNKTHKYVHNILSIDTSVLMHPQKYTYSLINICEFLKHLSYTDKLIIIKLTGFANIFSHSVGCFLILLMVSIPNCLILLLLLLLLVSNLKNYWKDYC